MIHKILTRLSTEFQTTPAGQQELRAYTDMNVTKGWKVHQAMLATIGNEIAMYMLSEQYTNLPASEKDIQQRAFFIVKELIDFLMDPTKASAALRVMKRHNEEMAKRMKATQ